MKVSIKNFQSIKNAELVFPIGMTVIVGSTNSGKTAIMRGMMASMTNPKTGKHFIRDNEKESCVAISDDEGEFEWIRGEKTVSYKVKDQLYDKCGKSDIWSIIPNYSIKKEDNSSILNFHTEYDSLFPFRYTPGELFNVFERIVSLDDTSSVLKDIQSDITSVSCSLQHVKDNLHTTEVITSETKETIEEIVKEIAVTNTIYTDSSSTSIMFQNQVSNTDTIDLIKSSILSCLDCLSEKEKKIYELTLKLQELNTLSSKLNNLYLLEDITCSNLIDRFDSLNRYLEKTVAASKHLNSCKSLTQKLHFYSDMPNQLSCNLSLFQSLYNEFQTLQGNTVVITKIQSRLETLWDIVELPVAGNLVKSYEEYIKVLEYNNSIREIGIKCRKYAEVPVINQEPFKLCEASHRLLSQLECSTVELTRLNDKKKSIDSNIHSIKDKLNLYFDEMNKFDVCPLCERPIIGSGSNCCKE